MRTLLALVALVAVASPAYAAESEQPAKPATKLEAFQVKTGTVIVRGYTTVGELSGSFGSSVSVDAREFRDPSNPKVRITGVSVTVNEGGRTERESTSFIDADEIESLLKGLDYISKATKTVTSLESFEMEYKTKGDFSVVVFNEDSGKLSVAVTSGRIGRTKAYLSLEDLDKLKTLLVSARTKTK